MLFRNNSTSLQFDSKKVYYYLSCSFESIIKMLKIVLNIGLFFSFYLKMDAKIQSGTCPKMESQFSNVAYTSNNNPKWCRYSILFETYKPEYLLLVPLLQTYSVQTQIYNDYFIDLSTRQSDRYECKLHQGLRFNLTRNKFEIVIYEGDVNDNQTGPIKIECSYETPFNLVYIDREDFSLFWSCAQLNVSFYDESVAILAKQTSWEKYDDFIKDTFEKVKKVLENKTKIMDYAYFPSYDYIKGNPYGTDPWESLCKDLKCPGFERVTKQPNSSGIRFWQLVTVAVVVVVLIIMIIVSIILTIKHTSDRAET